MSETYTPPLSTVSGKDYLEVKHRVYWVRHDHKDAQIVTDLISHDAEHGYAVVKAIVTLPGTGAVGTGYGMAERGAPGPAAKRYIEFAETRAIGRACAAVGYGTLAALEEDTDPADAPQQAQRAVVAQERRAPREAAPNTPAAPNGAPPAAGNVSESASPSLSTSEQHTRIRDLVGPAGMTIDSLLQHQGLTSLADFTEAKAKRIIERLEAKIAAATTDPASPVADTPRLQAVR